MKRIYIKIVLPLVAFSTIFATPNHASANNPVVTISEVKISPTAEYSIGDSFTVTFRISTNGAIPVDAKNNIYLSFANGRFERYIQSTTSLSQGSLENGVWTSVFTVPNNAITGFYELSIRPKGSWERFFSGTLSQTRRVVNIKGVNPPVNPAISVFDIVFDKQSYTRGETIKVSFSTSISGKLTEYTFAPRLTVQNLQTGNFININAVEASGNYSLGKWMASIQLPSPLSNGIGVIQIQTPSRETGVDYAIETLSSPFQLINGLPDINISKPVLDKTLVSAKSFIQITFSTVSSGSGNTISSRPRLILTDLAGTDVGDSAEARLISGTINSGDWSAVLSIPSGIGVGQFRVMLYNQDLTLFEELPTITVKREPQFTFSRMPSLVSLKVKKYELEIKSDADTQTSIISTDGSVCTYNSGVVNLLSSGKCTLKISQPETQNFLSANREFSFVVTSPASLKKIICVRGKSLKTVISANPKCPPGYKLK